MQATGYLPTIRRSGVQVVIIAAVAAMGVGFGRWIVPTADSGSTVVTPTRSEPSVTARAEAISGLKLAQMDARDASHGTRSVLTASAPKDRGIVQLKLAQMDARDATSGKTSALTADASRDKAIVQLKLAQMDLRDAR